MRKKLIILGVAGLMAIPAAPAFAGNGDGGYGTQPGASTSQSQTECAGHGAFGAYSHGAIPTNYPDPHTRAANGQSTGNNNSGLCGNPQDGK